MRPRSPHAGDSFAKKMARMYVHGSVPLAWVERRSGKKREEMNYLALASEEFGDVPVLDSLGIARERMWLVDTDPRVADAALTKAPGCNVTIGDVQDVSFRVPNKTFAHAYLDFCGLMNEEKIVSAWRIARNLLVDGGQLTIAVSYGHDRSRGEGEVGRVARANEVLSELRSRSRVFGQVFFEPSLLLWYKGHAMPMLSITFLVLRSDDGYKGMRFIKSTRIDNEEATVRQIATDLAFDIPPKAVSAALNIKESQVRAWKATFTRVFQTSPRSMAAERKNRACVKAWENLDALMKAGVEDPAVDKGIEFAMRLWHILRQMTWSFVAQVFLDEEQARALAAVNGPHIPTIRELTFKTIEKLPETERVLTEDIYAEVDRLLRLHDGMYARFRVNRTGVRAQLLHELRKRYAGKESMWHAPGFDFA